MDTNPDPEAELTNGIADRASASNCARGPVEAGGEKTVACGIDLAASVSCELAADASVVLAQDLRPLWPGLDRVLC
jgi:hypothetical protein